MVTIPVTLAVPLISNNSAGMDVPIPTKPFAFTIKLSLSTCTPLRNLKDNITPIEDPLAKVLSISGNTFNWNDKSKFEGQGDTGVVAQEIEALGLPGIVKDQESGHKSVQYHKLVPLLIEAIKELSTKVENLEQKLQDK